MPRKDRVARPTRAEKFPSLNVEFDSFDFDAKPGTYEVDKSIALLNTKGLLKPYDEQNISRAGIERYREVRRRLVSNAQFAWVCARHELELPKQNATLDGGINALQSAIQAVGEATAIIGQDNFAFVMGYDNRRHPETFHRYLEIKEQGEELVSRMRHFADATRERKLNLPTNADPLSKHFVASMRQCWKDITGELPPKTGGALLIQLASDTWRMVKFPRKTSELKVPLEDWLAARFKNIQDGPTETGYRVGVEARRKEIV